ncbi:endonuclease domain-containing protein [uncultured Phenylobacterium sp.]|uniref:endonuclease domain-containing protein n=1 Tax=uncultured Phenylobacterium sp. TaxID=349273 RepID=UPI0025D9A42E|nr:endonuclease domain-containing protein [uncultured Phenylobacterium sp.]
MAEITSLTQKLRRDRARHLRRTRTEAETLLWEALRATRLDGWKWRRQTPVGPFIVDFLCLEAALAVELDGGAHADQADYDARRDAYLRRQGLHVARFWNREVIEDPAHVRHKILTLCRESDPSRRGHLIPRGRRAV